MIRIEKVELRRVRLPLVHRFQTSSHAKRELEHILVTLTGSDGAVGWGEIASPSGPFYSAETVDSCWAVARTFLAPLVLAARWEHPSELAAAMAKVRGNHFARAGFDMAGWALWSRAMGVPLSKALGGERAKVEAGVSLGIEATIDDLLAQVEARVAEGYRRVKLKIAPGWDVEPVRAVRAAFPSVPVHVDANGAYALDARAVFEELDGLGLLMIEQPFAPRALTDHAALQAILTTPICLDESVEEVDDLVTALRLGAGRILNIKVSRMGGLTPAVRAHDLAVAHDVPVWCGGMHEFGIGRAANVALSSLPGFTLPSDVSGSDKYYARDVTREPVVCDGGFVEVPSAPGLGWEADLDFLDSRTTGRETVSP
ncbi:O-succinylbenzoate synthase [Actinoplanes campanulatus]|uniref:o-succinylbenzoate synthase n=1 Tax=Actinoplanes campanulatus TaxID=113559 RepID=A0A7W5AFE9_9ACTN|nr:o-succinylbenzoate synthase [Actinoplanes campanulatus]MBB3095326.1 O-succinylbenzoate synthase [Actinoplanes campanulatus]GGN41539.1 o-succinylbenzoate synthase [Actinoplanes campanulatus]GID34930.1 o-succinylbenzoate synthase [Actinoplanes campanulatus]